MTGNQWYWAYEYPDNGGFEFDLATSCPTTQAARARRAAASSRVDNRMVVPVGAVVKVITTSNDVIHAFGVPAFWVKIDAVPGRLNETWFRAERPASIYGVCYELCGARHGYMPIAVEVVQPRAVRAVGRLAGRPSGAAPGGAGHAGAAPAAAAAATARPPPPAHRQRHRRRRNAGDHQSKRATTDKAADRHDRHHRKRRPFRGRPRP